MRMDMFEQVEDNYKSRGLRAEARIPVGGPSSDGANKHSSPPGRANAVNVSEWLE